MTSTLQPLVEYDLDLPPLDITLTDPLDRRPRLRRRVPGRVARAVRTHRVDLAVVAVLVALGATVHLLGMDRSPARFDDEGTYVAYAWAVQNWHVLSHYTYWYAHPPLGWIQIAGWTTVTDAFDRAPYAVAAGREFMVVCKVASIVVLYALSRRLGYSRVAGALAVGIFALSPLAVYFTRAALLDNIVTPWLLGAFLFGASRRRSVRGAVASAGCLAVAVLTKETALLYLPAVLLLLWQHTDRRNRRFVLCCFSAVFVLIGAAFPLFALINNELLVGRGHVSLEWAVRWQLFERVGSGSIFNPHSTAHAVIRSWLDQDPWLPRLSLVLVPAGLVVRRTRAVALAFAVQVVQLLRGGYLPYPYVIAMIPFAALTIAGVFDWAWDLGLARRFARSSTADRALPTGLRRGWRTGLRRGWRIAVAVTALWLAALIAHAWSFPLRDLRTVDRDAGKAQALTWLRGNVGRSEYLVVDDSFWVDLVRAGHPSDHVVWFTKLDVDPEVKIPGAQQWMGVAYVVLDHQDDLSVHLQADGRPSKDTLDLYPTLARAVLHSRTVATFGRGLDAITIRQVDPTIGTRVATPAPLPRPPVAPPPPVPPPVTATAGPAHPGNTRIRKLPAPRKTTTRRAPRSGTSTAAPRPSGR